MKKLFILFILLSTLSYSQEQKKGVFKFELAGVIDNNFYQLGYEFNIKDQRSFQISAGYGDDSGVNFYALGLQGRYYLSQLAPKGFHVGPRVMAM